MGDIAKTTLQAVGDLLPIKAELSEDNAEDDGMSSDEDDDDDDDADSKFTSQLYLYEAVGNICSPPAVPVSDQVIYIRSIMTPLSEDMSRNLPAAISGDARAVLQVHHLILAQGTLAYGFSEWTPNSSSNGANVPIPEIAEEFTKAAEAILVALEALNTSQEIRIASRSSFSRLVGVLGNRILPQLPRWIRGLLSRASTKDEISMFLRLLDQIVFNFKTEIFHILDDLLTPFLQRVFEGMQEPITGTDDKFQLTELKQQYLTFVMAVLWNDQAGIFVSNKNQAIFESVISTLEHFTKDTEDYTSAKLAFTTLIAMCTSWGGPDVIRANGTSTGQSPQPALPGFDRFMIERFSPLVWALPSNAAFDPRDAQAKNVLGEAAGLQMAIYIKLGAEYLSYLEQTELKNLGLNPEGIKQYLEALVTVDSKKFKRYFQVSSFCILISQGRCD